MQPTPKELNDSIEDLRNYRNRLRMEIITMSKKLRMSSVKIQATLDEHSELSQIEEILKTLTSQKDEIST